MNEAETDWPNFFARVEARFAEHDRVIAEQAWDEGHDDGVTNMEQDSMIEAGLRRRLTNPYRKQAPDD